MPVGVRERNRRKYCSAACTIKYYRATNPEYLETSRKRNRESSAALTAARRLTYPVIPCESCGTEFVKRRQDGRYCSLNCRRRESAQRRRAMEAGVKIRPAQRWRVFARDGWACQICFMPVNREVAFPHREFPTIDHIVPLSLGGEHSEENWQTAHHGCNSGKGARL